MRLRVAPKWKAAILRVLAVGAAAALLLPQYSSVSPDHYHSYFHTQSVESLDTGPAHGVLTLHVDGFAGPLPYVVADIVLDEEFISSSDLEPGEAVDKILRDANGLLAVAGVSVRAGTIGQWRSDDSERSIPILLRSAVEQGVATEGNMFLAITGQYTGTYDGWSEGPGHRLIVRYYDESAFRTRALVAHEVGHLLGARHHEREEDCDEDGCVMAEQGFAYADTWCDDHLEVIGEGIEALLAAQNTQGA